MAVQNKWLYRLDLAIERNLSDRYLNNQSLAETMSISERQLFRKIRELTDLSPQQYLRQYRLQRAMQYLRDGQFRTVKETAFAVGFANVSYFIQQFEQEFGIKPLAQLQRAGWR